MKYKGYFKNINDKLRTVEVNVNDGTSTEREIMLSSTPFTINYTSEQKNLYKPVKYSGGNLGIVADDYFFNIFSAKAQDVSVKLLDENNDLLWIGYITPALYNQSYQFVTEDFDVELIDGLSTLQYLDYEPVNGNRGVVTFGDCIMNCVRRCNCYENIYFHHCLSHKESMQTGYDDFLQQIKVNENNFYEDDEDLTKSIKMDEVLDRLLTFLKMTMFAYKGNVFVVDYDALGKGISTFNKYDIATGNFIQKVNFDLTQYNITADSYRASNGQISLTPQYGKIKVVTEANVVDDLIPKLLDDKYLRTVKFVEGQVGDRIFNIERKVKYVSDSFFAAQVHKEHRYFKGHFYDNNLLPSKNPYPINANPQEVNVGGYIIANRTDEKRKYDDVMKDLGTTNYLCLATHRKYSTEQIPLYTIEMPPDMLNNVVLGGDTKLVINANVKVIDAPSENYTSPAPMSVEGDCSAIPPSSYKRKDDKVTERDGLGLRMRISAGNSQYFNGTEWQNGVCDCYIPLTVANDEEYGLEVKTIVTTGELVVYKKWKHSINQQLKIKNTVDNYRTNKVDNIVQNPVQYDAEGFAMPLPNNYLEISNLRIEFLLPEHPIIPNYSTHYIWISNFSIKAVAPKQWETKRDSTGKWVEEEEVDNESDTMYENVIDENYTEEFDDINLKVHTYDNKKANISSVVFSNYNRPMFLDKVYNDADKQFIRQEEHIIYNLVNQYKLPAKILDITLENVFAPFNLLYDSNLKNTFIIDEMEVDYAMDTASLKLIEKK